MGILLGILLGNLLGIFLEILSGSGWMARAIRQAVSKSGVEVYELDIANDVRKKDAALDADSSDDDVDHPAHQDHRAIF